MFFDISDPIFDVVKGFFICNIINEHNPHSPSVICSGYSSETFLKYLRLVMVCLSGKYFNKGLYRLLWAFKALHVITWPAVSQIWSLIFLPSSSIVRILKSMPRNYNARIDVHICLVDCNWNIALNILNISLQGLSNLPIVDMNVALKASSENRNNTQVFPTPESPISSSLNR